ncbi:metallophosphoesterase [uncultured Mucilaginibacter sp.]|uniref:metallophosphoesterase family protein n=1 Tax=uncultured Mucilaginibacter sp. TaxID=797541 RepID=UPI0025DBF4A1|nr:metallophosphoesterase [uncultured Mucilaginibacter sp.]
MITRRHFLRLSSIAALGLTSFKNFKFFGGDKINYNIILGRATANSITVNLMLNQDAEAFIAYGSDKNNLKLKTPLNKLFANNPVEFVLTGLAQNQRFYYQVCYSTPGSTLIKEKPLSFRTQRKKGSDFVFTISADSHLGTLKHCSPALYQTTLNNVVRDEPDLHFSLGDDFRASKVNNPDYKKIEQLYLDQREHLNALCSTVPFYFILGNHELEAKAYNDGTDNCLAAWSTKARLKFVPNPSPDGFYTGNSSTAPGERRENYYAFEWGDVLFITMDVFWYSNISADDEEMREKNKNEFENLSKEERIKARAQEKDNKGGGRGQKDKNGPHKDQWAFTIGEEQYKWLQQTLAKSNAMHKFVFGHHVLGACRGAVEWAGMFEWGGKNRRGIEQFADNRPGWEMPIHQLFVKNKVTAFIQGHDHLFVRQEMDGIAYITCPMSGDPGYNTYNNDKYLSGDKLSNTGHLRVSVTANDVQMQYIKAVLHKDESAQGKNGSVAYAYSFVQKKVLPTT